MGRIKVLVLECSLEVKVVPDSWKGLATFIELFSRCYL